jgi:hypothetical protein
VAAVAFRIAGRFLPELRYCAKKMFVYAGYATSIVYTIILFNEHFVQAGGINQNCQSKSWVSKDFIS